MPIHGAIAAANCPILSTCVDTFGPTPRSPHPCQRITPCSTCLLYDYACIAQKPNWSVSVSPIPTTGQRLLICEGGEEMKGRQMGAATD